MVVGWCHLYEVRSYNVDARQSFQNLSRLASSESGTDRCTGAWGIRGIKAIDIKSQISFVVPNNFTNVFDYSIRIVPLYPGAIEDIKA